MTIKKILFPVDVGRSPDSILPHAASLASRFDAEVVIYHAIGLDDLSRYGDPLQPAGREGIEARAVGTTEQFLKSVRASPLFERVKVTSVHEMANDPAEAVVSRAAAEEVDLIVMETTVKTFFRRLVMGSVAERVLRLAGAPVLVRHTTDQPQLETLPHYERILVATDFSDASQAVTTQAAALADAYESRVHLVHVLEEFLLAVYVDTGLPTPLSPVPELKKKAGQSLESAAEKFFPGRPTAVHVLAGKPVNEIVEFARLHDVDLIVMGVHGHDSFGEQFLGSNTDRVVRSAPCPVYVAHP